MEIQNILSIEYYVQEKEKTLPIVFGIPKMLKNPVGAL